MALSLGKGKSISWEAGAVYLYLLDYLGDHGILRELLGLYLFSSTQSRGMGNGSISGNSSPTGPALGWPRQEGKEGILASSHKAQETGSAVAPGCSLGSWLSASNQ